MIDGYTCWKLHRAISFHLKSLKYDLFQYSGRTVNSTLDNYNNGNKRIFELLAKLIKTPQAAVQFFIANIIYSRNDDAFDRLVCWDNYKLWLRHKEALTKYILDDLDKIDIQADILGNPPKLLRMAVAGEVMPQTVSALNLELNFLDKWTGGNYLGMDRTVVICRKLLPFIRYDREKIKDRLCEFN